MQNYEKYRSKYFSIAIEGYGWLSQRVKTSNENKHNCFDFVAY